MVLVVASCAPKKAHPHVHTRTQPTRGTRSESPPDRRHAQPPPEPDSSSSAAPTTPHTPANALQGLRFDPRDPAFFDLAGGISLRSIDPYGRLKLYHGLGSQFGPQQWQRFEQTKSDKKIHWAVGDPERHLVIAQSAAAGKTVYGASVSKPIIVASLLRSRDGELSRRQWRDVLEFLTLSDNTPWNTLEVEAGGKPALDEFTAEQGYPRIRAAQRDNQVNALDLVHFLEDVYDDVFPGAEAMFKIMAACATGSTKSRKYLPRSVVVGGKTGTTQTYRHDMRFLLIHEHWYTIVVLTERGDNEDVAIMFGGLSRERLGIPAEATRGAAVLLR